MNDKSCSAKRNLECAVWFAERFSDVCVERNASFRLVLTETEFLLCEIEYGTLLFVTAEARMRTQANPCGICGGQSVLDWFLPEYFGFTPSVSFHQCSMLSLILVLLFVTCKTSHTEVPFWEMGALERQARQLLFLSRRGVH